MRFVPRIRFFSFLVFCFSICPGLETRGTRVDDHHRSKAEADEDERVRLKELGRGGGVPARPARIPGRKKLRDGGGLGTGSGRAHAIAWAYSDVAHRKTKGTLTGTGVCLGPFWHRTSDGNGIIFRPLFSVCRSTAAIASWDYFSSDYGRARGPVSVRRPNFSSSSARAPLRRLGLSRPENIGSRWHERVPRNGRARTRRDRCSPKTDRSPRKRVTDNRNPNWYVLNGSDRGSDRSASSEER